MSTITATSLSDDELGRELAYASAAASAARDWLHKAAEEFRRLDLASHAAGETIDGHETDSAEQATAAVGAAEASAAFHAATLVYDEARQLSSEWGKREEALSMELARRRGDVY